MDLILVTNGSYLIIRTVAAETPLAGPPAPQYLEMDTKRILATSLAKTFVGGYIHRRLLIWLYNSCIITIPSKFLWNQYRNMAQIILLPQSHIS